MPAGGSGLTGWLSAIYRSCSEGATISGSVTSATTVVSASNNLYLGGSFQVTSAGPSCTITYEQSNDGTTWVTLPVISAAAPTAAPATTSTTAGIYITGVSTGTIVQGNAVSQATSGISIVSATAACSSAVRAAPSVASIVCRIRAWAKE